MSAIFLSAAVPFPDPCKIPTDQIAAREAVLALISQMGERQELCFGGHPAISPFILNAADSRGLRDNITIFQARWFEDQMPSEHKYFQNFQLDDGRRWSTEEKRGLTSNQARDAMDESLSAMRNKMLSYRKYAAAFFIGGKDGVVKEWKQFAMSNPHAHLFPIASTGGAALELWDDYRGLFLDRWYALADQTGLSRYDPSEIYERLKSSRHYRGLMFDLLSLIPPD